MRGRSAGAWLVVLWTLSVASLARATDFDQFQNARTAYESLNYELAADLFEGLLADAAPGDKLPLTSESRKYLGATYLFLGRGADAEAQFALLLQAEPEYVLDPLAFPDEVVKAFTAVKAHVAERRAKTEENKARSEAKDRIEREAATEEQGVRMRRLLQLAKTERVVEERSRWIAAMPFGAGQFQNDNDDLGYVLAISQGLLLATSIVSFAVHESLRDQEQPAPDLLDDARLAEAASRYTNQISLGLFTAIAIAGVVDAQVRFKPSRSFDRPRQVPPGVDLSLGLGDVGVKGTF